MSQISQQTNRALVPHVAQTVEDYHLRCLSLGAIPLCDLIMCLLLLVSLFNPADYFADLSEEWDLVCAAVIHNTLTALIIVMEDCSFSTSFHPWILSKLQSQSTPFSGIIQCIQGSIQTPSLFFSRLSRTRLQSSETYEDYVKAQIWGRLQKNKFGANRTLLRAGCLTKLSDRGRRALVREVTKNQMFTLAELQRSCMEMEETSRRTTLQSLQPHTDLGLWPLVSEKHMKACLEFAKKAPKGLSNKILQSDETNILSVMSGGNQAPLIILQIPRMVVACCGGVFSAAGTGGLVRVEGKLNGAHWYPSWNPGPVRSGPQTGQWP